MGIWAIAIATAFVIGTLSANPVVEAVGGWKEALGLHEGDSSAHHDIPESQIYELSEIVTINAGSRFSSPYSLTCLSGDWLNIGSGLQNSVALVADPVVQIRDANLDFIFESSIFSKAIGLEGNAELQDMHGFPVQVTATILCLSPS